MRVLPGIRINKFFTYCMGIASAIAVLSMPAKAETTTESFSWDITAAGWQYAFPQFNFALPTFNSSMGSLTGVRFELDTRFNAGVLGAVYLPESRLIGSTALTSDMVVGSFDVTGFQWDIYYEKDFAYDFAERYESHAGPHLSHVALDIGGDLSPFLGDGINTLQFWSVLALDVSTSANMYSPEADVLGYVSAENTFSIQYSYVSAIPEPETYAMMLAGLGLLGVIARRRKQRLNAYAPLRSDAGCNGYVLFTSAWRWIDSTG
jgi:hypothetical protein